MATSAVPTLSHRQFNLLALSILAAIGVHLLRMPIYLTLLLLSLMAIRWLQHRYYPKKISIALKLPLIFFLFLLILSHYGNVFGREMGSALASAMLVLKLIESEHIRDARMGIAFASFVLMSALLSTQNLSFTLMLSVGLALFLTTLRELQPSSAIPGISRPSLPQHLLASAKSLLISFPVSICFFLFLPRLNAPLWGVNSFEDGAKTGVSDSMSPGGIAELLLSETRAFTVVFDGKVPEAKDLYWRGPVLAFFDGATWKRLDNPLVRKDTALLDRMDQHVTYEVTLEPTRQNWLFALDMPIEAPTESARDSAMMLIGRRPISQLRRYQVVSALDYRLEPTLNSLQRAQALQLPAHLNPQARALALNWRNKYQNDQEVIQTALDLFQQSFTYSLQDTLLEGTDKVDDFLFHTQRGYCEHFSSAFVFLMRAAGIPARVVTGYQGGWYSQTGNYLLVRQSDAHAWAEVWLPDYGWRRIDPTAAVSPERIERGSRVANATHIPWYQADWLVTWRNRFDFINQQWNQLVLQFNAARQTSVLQRVGFERADYRALVWLLLSSVGVLFILLAWWALRQPKEETDKLDAAYKRLCQKLARAGIQIQSTEGPRAFAERVALTQPESAHLTENLIGRYIQLRYASIRPSTSSVNLFAHQVKTLRLPGKTLGFSSKHLLVV